MTTMLERVQRGEFPLPAIAQTIGFTLNSLERGRSVFQMETDPARHANPMGTVHGGVLCDIADAAMGMAFASTLEEDESFTTLELKINYLRPVWRATLTAVGQVINRGRTVGLVECRITDEQDRVVAHATSTCMVLRGNQAEGR